MDKSLTDINTTRAVVVDNFDGSYNMTENFEVVSGNTGAFISENRWNIGAMYFNPSPNTVPSNQTPTGEEISATIEINFSISNYSTYPISVTIAPLGGLTNPLDSIVNDGNIGYDLSEANIASIAGCNVARDNVSSANSTIYLKLNNLGLDISNYNFGFSVTLAVA